jgi:antitoxin component of MazEF toxin-antitoxin module
MVKTLTSHGNSAALIIDKAILELLGISMGTPLKITTDGKSLIVSPLPDGQHDKRFKAALKRVNEVHGNTLKKLGQ